MGPYESYKRELIFFFLRLRFIKRYDIDTITFTAGRINYRLLIPNDREWETSARSRN